MEELVEYIAADSPRYAVVFAKRIMQVVRAIPANPEIGRMVPEYGDPKLREKVLQGCIVYRFPGSHDHKRICGFSRKSFLC